jgi:hypothetical protein
MRPDTVLAPAASSAASSLLFRWPKVWLWGASYVEAHELRSAPSTPPAMLEYMWCYRCAAACWAQVPKWMDQTASGQVAGHILAAIRRTAEESYSSVPNFKLRPPVMASSPLARAWRRLADSPAQKMSSAFCPPSLPTYTKSHRNTSQRPHISPISTIFVETMPQAITEC